MVRLETQSAEKNQDTAWKGTTAAVGKMSPPVDGDPPTRLTQIQQDADPAQRNQEASVELVMMKKMEMTTKMGDLSGIDVWAQLIRPSTTW